MFGAPVGHSVQYRAKLAAFWGDVVAVARRVLTVGVFFDNVLLAKLL